MGIRPLNRADRQVIERRLAHVRERIEDQQLDDVSSYDGAEARALRKVLAMSDTVGKLKPSGIGYCLEHQGISDVDESRCQWHADSENPCRIVGLLIDVTETPEVVA